MLTYIPNQGPTIGLFDENNAGKALISVTNGNPSVTLLDKDKKPAIAMLNRKGEGSILGIWNRNNEPAVSLAVKGDKPGLFMYQQPRTGLLFNTAGGRPALALMNHGTPVWSATGDTPPALDMPISDDMHASELLALIKHLVPRAKAPGETSGPLLFRSNVCNRCAAILPTNPSQRVVRLAQHGMPGVCPRWSPPGPCRPRTRPTPCPTATWR